MVDNVIEVGIQTNVPTSHKERYAKRLSSFQNKPQQLFFLNFYCKCYCVCFIQVLLKSQFIEQNTEHQLEREITIHSYMKHPNIIRMYNYFSAEQHVILIMEYAPGGSLYNELQKRRRFDAKHAAEVYYNAVHKAQ